MCNQFRNWFRIGANSLIPITQTQFLENQNKEIQKKLKIDHAMNFLYDDSEDSSECFDLMDIITMEQAMV